MIITNHHATKSTTNFLPSLKKSCAALTIALASISSTTVHAENDVMMQYFQWYTADDGALWTEVQQQAASSMLSQANQASQVALSLL
jgi:hypothetical protein